MFYMYIIRVHITSTYAFIIVILPMYAYTLTIYTEMSYNFISPSCLYPVLDISFDITRRKIILSKLPSLSCVLQSHRVFFSEFVFDQRGIALQTSRKRRGVLIQYTYCRCVTLALKVLQTVVVYMFTIDLQTFVWKKLANRCVMG